LLASVRARIKARRRQFITGKQPNTSA
jgi:hypothetical protein